MLNSYVDSYKPQKRLTSPCNAQSKEVFYSEYMRYITLAMTYTKLPTAYWATCNVFIWFSSDHV